ncbi:hypothetical protein L1765_11100 [Microaerobacter geothermalis]|uniref:hypothetical protein n=1 Tax=Microaerobacter geothermalis TaxID=674972 RepID=UPI001F355C02|nr:hypothetical protein [Microaerobacter geothermalis]MCF6094510.1 hypothetical protein [Microaerobacter geothermalis]
MIKNVKYWIKNEDSQVSSETGLLTVGGLLLAAGVMTLVYPQAKTAFGNIMSKFTSASSGNGMVADPLGTGQADWAL